MVLTMSEGINRTFEGVAFHGATYTKESGLTFQVSPRPGEPPRAIPSTRIVSLMLNPEEQSRTYSMLLSQPNGNFRRFDSVRFTEVSPSSFQAIPKGYEKPFPVQPAAVVHIEPTEKLDTKNNDLWQAQLSAQAFLVSPAKPKPLSANQQATISKAAIAYSTRPPGPATQGGGIVGRPFPNVKLLGPSGAEFGFQSLSSNKPLVLVVLRGFSGYVCPYCTAQTAAIVKALPEFEGLGARVALVYPGPAETVPLFLDSVRQYRQSGDVPLPVMFDKDLALVKALGISGQVAKPTTIVVDKAGVIRFAHVGQGFQDRPSIPAMLAAVGRLSE